MDEWLGPVYDANALEEPSTPTPTPVAAPSGAWKPAVASKPGVWWLPWWPPSWALHCRLIHATCDALHCFLVSSKLCMSRPPPLKRKELERDTADANAPPLPPQSTQRERPAAFQPPDLRSQSTSDMESPLQALLREVEAQLAREPVAAQPGELAEAAGRALHTAPSASGVLEILLQPGVQVRRRRCRCRLPPLSPPACGTHIPALWSCHVAGLCARCRARGLLQGSGRCSLPTRPVSPSGGWAVLESGSSWAAEPETQPACPLPV